MQKIAHEVTLYAEPIYHTHYFTVTNALFTSWVVVVFIAVIAFLLRRNLREVPGTLQNIFEVMVEQALTLFDQVTNSRELSFRLFGNILAGEVLLSSISALLAYGAPIPFFFLEILVGFIQAMIFSMLLVVYFTVSAIDHDHEPDGHADANHSGREEERNELIIKPSLT
jgi:F0F1-type ATP synthase membrane subunit a